MDPPFIFALIPNRRHLQSQSAPVADGPTANEDLAATTISACVAATVIVIAAVFLLVTIKWYRLYNTHGGDGDPSLNDLNAALPVVVLGGCSSPPMVVDESCAICLENYEDGDSIRLLPKCEHKFHKECIDLWLTSRSSLCPICRNRAA